MGTDDIGSKLSTWNALVRRARIGRQLKAAAMIVSSYADTNGRDIKCGVARLAVDCEIGYSTARRYLAWMREVGLIELVRAGNRKAKRADEYRLTITPVTHERLDIPEAAEYRKLVEEVNVSNQSAQKARRIGDQRSPKESANATAEADSSALNTVSANDGYQRSVSAPSALTLDEPLPSSDHLPIGSAPSTGGAPPPDPRRPEPPPSSGSRIEAEQEISAAHYAAQDLQRNSLPRERAALAPVVDLSTWRAS